MKFKTVIFDLDGTLLDTLDDIMDSVNHTMKSFALQEATRAEIMARVGNGSGKLIELCLRGGKENALYGPMLAEYSSWYKAHCEIKTRPYPGIHELLRELMRCGCELAIVSNKPDDAVKSLAASKFCGLFSAAVGERTGVSRKPAPDTVLAAMQELGALPEETVYVGDSEVDIMTAKNAGLPCISVTWGFRTKAQLVEAGAAVLADDAEALRTLLI